MATEGQQPAEEAGSLEAVAAMLDLPPEGGDDEATVSTDPNQGDPNQQLADDDGAELDGTDATLDGSGQDDADAAAQAAAEADDADEEDGNDEDAFAKLFQNALGDEDDAESTDGDPADGQTQFDVKVDGEVRQVSLTDLKRSYALGGATEKRLQEATEARNTALQTAMAEVQPQVQQHLEAAAGERQKLAQLVSHYGAQLFAPRVQAPDPSMQETDPVGYLQRVEAYRQDQERVNADKAQAQGIVTQAQRDQQERVKNYAAEQRTKLHQMIPGLKKPEVAEKFHGAIARTCQAAGFTPQEIQSTLDARMLLVAAKAAAYDDLMLKTSKGNKKPRTRTPSAPGARVRRNGVSVKAQQTARNRAAETGRPEDVAALL